MRTDYHKNIRVDYRGGDVSITILGNEDNSPIRKILIMSTGMVAAFDKSGMQIAEAQGPLHDLLEIARKHRDINAEFQERCREFDEEYPS